MVRSLGELKRPALEHGGEDVALAGLHVGPDDAPAAVIRPLGHDHVAVRVELDAVGHAAGRAEDGRLPRFRIELPDVPRLDGALSCPWRRARR